MGAGIAGLTLACFLRTHKHLSVDIIEKQPDWSHLGYTLGIWDVGRQILAKLDLAEGFDKHSKRIQSYYLETNTGHRLKLYHFDDFYKTYETAYAHINRKTLHHMLLRQSQAKVRMNTEVQNLK